MSSQAAARPSRVLERSLVAAGLLLIGIYAVARISGEIGKRRAVSAFEEARASAPALAIPTVDTTLWSAQRIRAYGESERAAALPMAILRMPRLGLEVPVHEGTDELTLNRAVGLIEGTAVPGEPGNVGIAGHRDGFFRVLKDAYVGDALELRLLDRTESYVVSSIEIVAPEDVRVLAPTSEPSVTLVTCYPFYFAGSAPKRYIVQARKR